MAAPVKEGKPEPSTATPPATEQKSYSLEEAAIVARIKSQIGGDGYLLTILQTADERRDAVIISEPIRARRKQIVEEIDTLVRDIRADRNNPEKTHTIEDFDRFFDEHEGLPEYQFLSASVVGINVNGWGLFMGLLNPIEYGEKIGPRTGHQDKWKW